MIAAIDPGNRRTKYAGMQQRPFVFPSAIGVNDLARNLKREPGPYDFEWEYEGKCGFAGTLALEESEYVESRKDDSKAHFDAKLRTLIALHRFGAGHEFDIVVGQPIETHTEAEKTAIKRMYVGRHDLTINGQRKVITINRCEVSPEGAAAGLLVAPNTGMIRVIDIGSGSVNFATIIDRKFNNRGSWTFTEGMESKRDLQPAAFARQIASKAINRKWASTDKVYLVGGGALELYPFLQEYFQHAQPIDDDPCTANVRAFLMIARRVYG